MGPMQHEDAEAPQLLVRPPPTRHEGQQGYFLRVAENNFLRLNDLKAMGADFSLSWLEQQRLLPDKALYPQLYEYVDHISTLLTKFPRIWNRQFARFCPLCLIEHGVWKITWEVNFHDACPHHGVWLVDRCSSCFSPIEWNRAFLTRCNCGADLMQEHAMAAPPSVVALSGALETLLLNCSGVGVPEPLSGLGVDQVQRLILFLGGYLDPARGPKPLKLRNTGLLEYSWKVTTLAAEILHRWPEQFHECWSTLQNHGDGSKQGLQRLFNQAYSYLYKGLAEKSYEPVRFEFEKWLAENWRGGVTQRNRRLPPSLIERVQWIPGKEAANKLGISMSRLGALVQEGRVEGQLSISDSGRKFLMVRRDQLDEIDAELLNEMTLTDAMQSLGLNKLRMQNLLRVLFPGARRINDQQGMPWCVRRTDVEAILNLARHAHVLHIEDENQVSMAHVLKYWSWTAEDILNLIESLKRGTIKIDACLAEARGLSAWVFDSNTLKAWRLRHQGGQSFWLTVPKLSKSLGVKQEMGYWLVNNDIVTVASQTGHKGRTQTMVHRDEIEIFNQKYVLGSEVARQLGTSPKHALKLLSGAGISPIQGHGNESSPLKLYLKDARYSQFLAACAQSKSRRPDLLPIEALAEMNRSAHEG